MTLHIPTPANNGCPNATCPHVGQGARSVPSSCPPFLGSQALCCCFCWLLGCTQIANPVLLLLRSSSWITTSLVGVLLPALSTFKKDPIHMKQTASTK